MFVAHYSHSVRVSPRTQKILNRAFRQTFKSTPKGQLKRYRARGKVSIGISIVSGKEIRRANNTFRKKDKATDVLSFPQWVRGVKAFEGHLGDVLICLRVAKAQAKDRKMETDLVLADLLIHGLLHLLGYDHEKSAREEKMMFALQHRILATL
ncbi:MAG: rRNA maturation RNase YbeY [Deltaproteobacteria bacterium]|nr:rRNA maturation RNase YbeY [Deltaproteobacteria bacterium]MBI3295095.1 rRNA maturation RNase YbeY [Deltaproteobacteria bacterium]